VFAQLMQHLPLTTFRRCLHPLSGRVQSEILLVPGSIPVYGVRSVDLSGEPSSLIGIARPLYAQESFGVDLQETVSALDTTAIDLCLSVFPWAVFRTAKAAIKVQAAYAARSARQYPHLHSHS